MNLETKNAKSKKQIACEYGICTKTLTRWFKRERISTYFLWSIYSVKLLSRQLAFPSRIDFRIISNF